MAAGKAQPGPLRCGANAKQVRRLMPPGTISREVCAVPPLRYYRPAPVPPGICLALGASSRVVQHFELIFPDLDVDRPRLLLDQNAVDAGTLWAERSAILRDPGTAIAGVENFDDGADLQGFHQVSACHFQLSF